MQINTLCPIISRFLDEILILNWFLPFQRHPPIGRLEIPPSKPRRHVVTCNTCAHTKFNRKIRLTHVCSFYLSLIKYVQGWQKCGAEGSSLCPTQHFGRQANEAFSHLQFLRALLCTAPSLFQSILHP